MPETDVIYLRIPRTLHEIIKERAQRLGLNKSEVLRNVIAYGIAMTDPAMVTYPCSECGLERPADELLATPYGGVCPEHVAEEA